MKQQQLNSIWASIDSQKDVQATKQPLECELTYKEVNGEMIL